MKIPASSGEFKFDDLPQSLLQLYSKALTQAIASRSQPRQINTIVEMLSRVALINHLAEGGKREFTVDDVEDAVLPVHMMLWNAFDSSGGVPCLSRPSSCVIGDASHLLLVSAQEPMHSPQVTIGALPRSDRHSAGQDAGGR
jgi:hypothetical protein|eukprot:7299080-Prymnesium_polylepis.1